MSRILKITAAAVLVAGVFAAPIVRAGQNAEGEEASQGEVGAKKDRTFDETREFMRKHSEESKKTGKM